MSVYLLNLPNLFVCHFLQKLLNALFLYVFFIIAREVRTVFLNVRFLSSSITHSLNEIFRIHSNLAKLNRKRCTLKRCGLLVTLNYGPYAKRVWRNYSSFKCTRRPRQLLIFVGPAAVPRREIGMFVLRAVKSVMKIRYLLLGGAVSGGVTLQKVSFILYLSIILRFNFIVSY